MLQPTFLEDSDHSHDLTVSSVGVVVPGEIDPDKTQVIAMVMYYGLGSGH